MEDKKLKRKQFFNTLAEDWDNIVTHTSEKITKILDLLDIKSGDKVLDIGTGTGILIPFLQKRVTENGHIWAIDMAEEMIEVAREKYPAANIHFIADDISTIDFKTDYFDHILFYSVFPHLDDKPSNIRRMKEFLKQDGKMLIAHSEGRAWINDMHRKKSDAVKFDHLPDIETIKSYFLDCEMEVILEIDDDEMFVIIAKS